MDWTEGPLGQEQTREDGWTYLLNDTTGIPDYRHKPCGVRVQVQALVGGQLGLGEWLDAGVCKDLDDALIEIELMRAEPRPAGE